MLVIAHALIHILSTRFNGINDLVTEPFEPASYTFYMNPILGYSDSNCYV